MATSMQHRVNFGIEMIAENDIKKNKRKKVPGDRTNSQLKVLII
jgi:hypothetical protein